MAVAKVTAIKPATSFLDAGRVVGITTKNSYELGTILSVTDAYISYRTGETECAVPWAHIVKVESK